MKKKRHFFKKTNYFFLVKNWSFKTAKQETNTQTAVKVFNIKTLMISI